MGQKDDALKTLKIAEAMFKEMGMDYYLDKTQKLLECLMIYNEEREDGNEVHSYDYCFSCIAGSGYC